jgi:hypothetical protein
VRPEVSLVAVQVTSSDKQCFATSFSCYVGILLISCSTYYYRQACWTIYLQAIQLMYTFESKRKVGIFTPPSSSQNWLRDTCYYSVPEGSSLVSYERLRRYTMSTTVGEVWLCTNYWSSNQFLPPIRSVETHKGLPMPLRFWWLDSASPPYSSGFNKYRVAVMETLAPKRPRSKQIQALHANCKTILGRWRWSSTTTCRVGGDQFGIWTGSKLRGNQRVDHKA